MFTVDANITDLKIGERNLFKVLFSMNNHMVATPEGNVEVARSYVFFFREGGKVQTYIGLYFPGADRRMYYTNSSNPYPESQISDVEDDARAFAEDLGAMLDEIDFSSLSKDEKDRWIEDQEMLSGKKQVTEEARTEPAPEPASPAAETSPAQTAVPPVQQIAVPPEFQPAPLTTPVQPPQPAPLQYAVPPPVQPPAAPPHMPAFDPALPPAIPFPDEMPQAVQKTSLQQSPESVSPVPPQQGRRQQRRPDARPAGHEVPGTPLEPDRHTDGGRSPDELLELAVKEGVVKAPRTQLKKDLRSPARLISREKEALARLLASF